MDHVQLNFNPDRLWLLNAILGLVMLGIALDLRIRDFREVLQRPRGPLVGLAAQFLILPWMTLLLTLLLRPHPAIALGMIVVACCPGGNISNFMTHLAGGRTVLSVVMTSVSTLAALVLTPLHVAVLTSLNPSTAEILREVGLDPVRVVSTIFLTLVVPLTLGMLVAAKWPQAAKAVRGPFRGFSIMVFLSFVALSVHANVGVLIAYAGVLLSVVAIHNAMALSLGYGAARIARVGDSDRRAVTFEVGLQNSALALLILFNFFPEFGGAALVAAGWGIWHIASGLTLAFLWSRHPLQATCPSKVVGV